MASIETLLQEELAALGEFLAAIAAERCALTEGKLDDLPGATEQKSALATRLASLESQREALLTDSRLAPGRQGMESWLARQPPSARGAHQARWNALLEGAAKARTENEINGKLIATRLQQNQQALGGLLGEAAEASTYGADGQRSSGANRRTLGSA
ncbi:MAG: flagellar protein FlgN [Rhodocyclales bacterium]|nr:flagellar protein FlgN [Rhodocyclales bacterium]